MTARTAIITAPLERLRRAGRGGPARRRLLLLAAALLVSLAAAYTLYRRATAGDAKEAAYTEAQVARGPLVSSVSATGSVSASRSVKLSFATGGRLEAVTVKPGDTVQAGQEIARLDASALTIKRDTARSQLESARARLQALLDGPTAAELAAQRSAVAAAQAALARAENDLASLLRGSFPEEVAAAKAALDRAKAALDTAQANYEKLASGQDLTLRPEYTQLQQAKAEYQSALSTYTTKTSPPAPADLAAAQQAVQSARSALDAARAKEAALRNPSASDITVAQAAVAGAQAQLDAARAKYAALVIGGSLEEREAAQAAVIAAQAALDAAQARRSAVLGNKDSEDSDVLAANSAVAQAQAALQAAQANLARVQGQVPASELAQGEQAVRAAEIALANAEAALTKLLHPTDADLAAAKQAVAAAESALSTAQSTLDKLLRGPDATERAALQAAVDRAKAGLDAAQVAWDRLVSGADLDRRSETAALNQARADYASALAIYTAKVEGVKPGDVQSARAAVESARASLAAAQAKLVQMSAGTAQADLTQQQEVVTQLELALKSAQMEVDGAVLRAPFAGSIAAVSAATGDQVAAGKEIVTLLDPQLVHLDVTLDEASVAKVKPGQSVTVTFDALPGQVFSGQVASVGPAGSASQGVVTFPVSVVFDPRGASIPVGMTASVTIVTERKDGALTVPGRAIKRQGPKATVDVIGRTGALETREVQTGMSGDGGRVEIVSGLSEGEKVAVPMASGSAAPRRGPGGAVQIFNGPDSGGSSGGPSGGPIQIIQR